MMFLIVFSLILYALLFVALYPLIKALTYIFQKNTFPVLKVTALFNFIYVCLFLSSRYYYADLARVFANYLGVLSFGFYLSLGFWLCYFLVSRVGHSACLANKTFGAFFLIAWLSLVSIAVFNFHKPEVVVKIDLFSKKLSRPVRFVQLSDIQYGTTTQKEMNTKLELAYSLKPDFIVFTGDLIDFERYEFDDFNVLSKSPVPIYFERGNHEFYHDPTRLLSYLERMGAVKLLINQKAVLAEVEIVGVDFGRRENHLEAALKTIKLDPQKFSILLYHEPVDADIAVAKGFDLILYGHTHGGQIWPYTWLVDQMYEYADGQFLLGDSVVYTSDGVSLWGPRMRLGSQNELVLVTIRPETE